MTDMPFDTGVTIPVVAPIVATGIEDELHTPPPVALYKVVVEPIHMVNGDPVIAAGAVMIVSVFIAVAELQPFVTV